MALQVFKVYQLSLDGMVCNRGRQRVGLTARMRHGTVIVDIIGGRRASTISGSSVDAAIRAVGGVGDECGVIQRRIEGVPGGKGCRP